LSYTRIAGHLCRTVEKLTGVRCLIAGKM